MIRSRSTERCTSVLLGLLLAACATPEPRTYVFTCDESHEFVVRVQDGEAWVFRPGGSLRLPRVPAEQGEAYSDGAFRLTIRADQAEIGGHLCRNDRRRAIWEHAKLGGADFRAVGNEPGWNLEIVGQSRIVLVTDYGATLVEVPAPEPRTDPQRRTTRWDAGELVLEVTAEPCRDTMSGEAFESQVVVHWRGQTLRGCGRALH